MSTANSSAEQFLEQAQKLSLLQGQSLKKAQAEIGEEQEATAIARKLIRAGIISRWGASQFLKGRSLRWGKYQLIDQIGKDLNSPVYLAEHTQMERRVVLKVLSEAQASRRELRAVAQLDHRNLVHVYDIDHQNDKYYLVMEYVEGVDLAGVIGLDPPPPYENSAAYIYQAALGLAHAHQHGIVHRQIHPGNVMVDHEGVVKILNLDSARPADMVGEAGSKLEQLPPELIDYLSPEQAAEGGKVDYRSDIYSLGCVFYHLLTGHPPFTADSIAGRLEAHRNSQPQPIAALAPDVPTPLIAICERMMAKDPVARTEKMEAVAAELDEWLNEFEETRRATTIRRKPPVASVAGIEASGTSPLERVTSQGSSSIPALTKKQKIIAASATGVVAVLLLLGVVLALVMSGGDSADSEVVQAADEPEPLRTVDGALNQETGTNPRRGVDDKFPDPGELSGTGKPPGQNLPGPRTDENPKRPPAEENPDGKPSDPQKPNTPAAGKPTGPDPEVPPETDVQEPQPEPEKAPPEPVAEPEPAVPEASPISEPFKALPASVNLPDYDTTDLSAESLRIALGSVSLPAEANLFVSLLGGDVAAPGGVQFVVRADNSIDNVRKWQFVVVETDGSESPISELELADGELRYQWLPQAVVQRSANYLRNCSLSLQSSDNTHNIRLREPLQLEPITLDFDKPRMRTSVNLNWLPDDELITIEFTRLEGEFPETAWNPGAAVAADGGRAMLLFGANNQRVLSVQMRAEVRRGIQIDTVSFFKVATEAEPLVFSKNVAERTATKLIKTNDGLTIELNELKAVTGNNQKKQVEARIKFVEQQQVVANRAIDQFNVLKQFYNSLNNKGKIHFRVYYQAGGEDFILATSE